MASSILHLGGKCSRCGNPCVQDLHEHGAYCEKCLRDTGAVHCRCCHGNFLPDEMPMHSVQEEGTFLRGTCDACYVFRYELDLGAGQVIEFKTGWEQVFATVVTEKSTGDKWVSWWNTNEQSARENIDISFALHIDLDKETQDAEVIPATRRFQREFDPIFPGGSIL